MKGSRVRHPGAHGRSSRAELAPFGALLGALDLMFRGTPPDAGQELVNEAMGCRSRTRREALARQAIQRSPDGVDAYVLLAMDAPDPREARPLLEQAVAAGERALGPRFFHEERGHFWLLLETRPYMQAREMLASCLWALDERPLACEHYQEMLRLNPNDNQGIRYLLASCLLEMKEHEALARLLATYSQDATAAWAYTSALLAFRLKGPTAANQKKLDKALKANAFVPDYLLGREPLPEQLPDLVGWGDESEAMEYAAANKTAWEQTPGALEWLRYALGGWVLPPKSSSTEVREPVEPAPGS